MPWPFGNAARRRHALLWRGRDSTLFCRIVNALRESGIPFERTKVRGYEAMPPSLERLRLFKPPVLKVEVPSQELTRARRILRHLVELKSHA